jgi:hypothetical protein
MVIADVPTPLLCLSLIPDYETNISGLILPSYNDSNHEVTQNKLFCRHTTTSIWRLLYQCRSMECVSANHLMQRDINEQPVQ